MTVFLSLVELYANSIASAAAVASSNKDAFAIGNPVNSVTRVWKLNNDSNLPCDISA